MKLYLHYVQDYFDMTFGTCVIINSELQSSD